MDQQKVFGIGLSRTGNKSLHRALKILGYKPKYLPSMDEIFKVESATDISCVCFLEEIIKLNPEAKFVYTTRELKSWLTSCLTFFQPTKNAYFNYLRQEVYGDKIPSIDNLINARKKLEEKLTSLDHLVLPLEESSENKWKALCGYLDKPIPENNYPHIK